MSGPVWRRATGDGLVCDECLRTVDEGFVEGVVADATHRPGRTMCLDCYRLNGALLLRTEPEPFHHVVSEA